jgi:predicted small metal-binding protein/GNAT superfamily N-acetyltransferase
MNEPTGLLRVGCACGWEIVGTEDEVVAAVLEHGERIHNMRGTREAVLANARPADDATDRYPDAMHPLLATFDEQVRRRPTWDGVEHADRVIRIDHPSWKGVLWSDLDESTADAAIAQAIERFAGLGKWEWKHYSYDKPADLPDRLRAAGFVAEPTETLLIAEIATLPRSSPLPDGVELRDVEDEAGIAGMMQASDEGFGEVHNEAYGRETLKEIRAGRTRAVVAYADGRPISAGRVEFYQGTDFAALFGGATVPDWRRRGIFRAVVAHRTAQAEAAGYRYLQTDASDDSRPILERLGFIAVGTTTPFTHP